MNTDVLKFYRDKIRPIEALIARRQPQTLTPAQVELAAVELYDRIQSGEEVVKDIRIAWRVWEIAKTINTEEYEARVEKLLNHEEINNELIARLKANEKRSLRLYVEGLVLSTTLAGLAWTRVVYSILDIWR